MLSGRSEELERLAVEICARGLSTRDIETAFRDESGQRVLSRTAVSAVTERLWADDQAFAARDLAEFEVLYLFVDGIAERLHLGRPREGVLAAWGFTVDGKKMPLEWWPKVKSAAWSAYTAASPKLAELLRDEFVNLPARAACGDRVLPGRPRDLHRAPETAPHAPQGDAVDQPARAAVRRGAPAL